MQPLIMSLIWSTVGVTFSFKTNFKKSNLTMKWNNQTHLMLPRLMLSTKYKSSVIVIIWLILSFLIWFKVNILIKLSKKWKNNYRFLLLLIKLAYVLVLVHFFFVFVTTQSYLTTQISVRKLSSSKKRDFLVWLFRCWRYQYFTSSIWKKVFSAFMYCLYSFVIL